MEQARRVFLNVFKAVKYRDDEQGRRLRFYTRYWIATLDGEHLQADSWARQAREYGMGQRGIIALPARVSPDDEYDEEFSRLEKGLARDLKRRPKK